MSFRPGRGGPLGGNFLLGAWFAVVFLTGFIGRDIAPPYQTPSTPASVPTPGSPVPTATATVLWRPFPGDTATGSPENAVTIVFAGDLMFGRKVEISRRKKGIQEPFRRMRAALQDGDFAEGNLECVLGSREEFATWPHLDKIYLPAPRRAAVRLKASGFRLLSVGNNHSLDYGEAGLNSTFAALREENLLYVGTWEGDGRPVEPVVVTIRGKKVAFLAYSDVSPPEFKAKGSGHPGTIPPLPQFLRRDIPYARERADLVVVLAHWGVEYQVDPTPRQKTLAHLMVDLGADAVVGSHPHVVQSFERYKGAFIAYSLGNFLFDLKRPVSHPSLLMRLRLTKGEPCAADFVPVWAGDVFPRPPTEGEWILFPPSLRGTDSP